MRQSQPPRSELQRADLRCRHGSETRRHHYLASWCGGGILLQRPVSEIAGEELSSCHRALEGQGLHRLSNLKASDAGGGEYGLR